MGKETKTVYVFHHTDLDGMGCRLIGEEYAKRKGYEVQCFRVGYDEVDKAVQSVCNNINLFSLQDSSEIIIGDISVNEESSYMLSNFYNLGMNLILRDHHATAEWLNKFHWAEVHEKIDGIARCGTWQLANCFPDIMEDYKELIEQIDQWDTWKWKVNDNQYAKQLNNLHKIMGDNEFIKYAKQLVGASQPQELFNDTANLLISIQNRGVQETVNKCMRNIIESEIKVGNETYRTGLVFASSNFSEVADIILSERTDLDILGVVNLPFSISWRTQKELNTPLGDIARMSTGKGGGHPKASGSVIPKNFCKDVLRYLFKDKELMIKI